MDSTVVAGQRLAAALPGFAHLAGSAEYNSGRAGYGIVTTPAVVVRPRTVLEVSKAVTAVAAAGLPLWVKAGGHSHRLGDGVIVDLAEFRAVEVLSDGLVRIETGATWREVAERLTPLGLAVTSGDTGSVGVGGIVTGGGFGWLVRTVGLTVDLLRSATVVTADGHVRQVSPESDPELFWGLAGAGGNLGVVTDVVVQALPVDLFAAGRLTFAPEHLRSALVAWRDVLQAAPVTFNSSFTVGFADGPPAPAVSFALAGSADEATRILQPLLELPGVRVDRATVDYAGLFGPDPDGYPPVRMVGSNGFADLTDALFEALDKFQSASTPGAESWLLLRALGGAYAEAPTDAVLGHRDREVIVLPTVMLPDDADDASVLAARARVQQVLVHTQGCHSNFTPETGPAVISSLYPPHTLRRLQALKQRVDPGWLFRPVHTIGREEDADPDLLNP